MKLLIEGGLVLDLNNPGNYVVPADVLIENDLITAVIPGSKNVGIQADRVINAEGKLLMPGLVNAHLHSETHLQKGLYEGLPLEVWLPCIIPVLGSPEISMRLVYLSAMLGAIHMLKRGTTTIVDHWIESVPLADGFSTVVDAYQDSGIRAFVGIDFTNKPLHEEIPELKKILPESLCKQLSAFCSNGDDDYITLCKSLVERYGSRERRVRAMLGFSAIQRCSDTLLRGLGEISKETGVPLHGHMLETRTQFVGARDLYKEGIVKRIDNLGLLNNSLSLAHSIWATLDDAKLMGDRGVTVVHNPVSNLKLGSGVMPLRMLESAGVNIALGTDGASSNDNLNMFEVMKFAALIHTIDSMEFKTWPSSPEVLRYATKGGARGIGIDGTTGAIEPGKKADIVILNLANTTYLPLNNPLQQIVYCEDGGSVETVLIDGQIVVEGGVVQKVNEKAILMEIKELQEEYQNRMQSIAKANASLIPYLESLYYRSMERFSGLNSECKGKYLNVREE
jgi:5-methylthioadenosine/S-adenosylhomocysteine deaminase